MRWTCSETIIIDHGFFYVPRIIIDHGLYPFFGFFIVFLLKGNMGIALGNMVLFIGNMGFFNGKYGYNVGMSQQLLILLQ
jgi:hypothetical protein